MATAWMALLQSTYAAGASAAVIGSRQPMVPYSRPAVSTSRVDGTEVASFVTHDLNADRQTVQSFGDEWNRFSSFTEEETRRAGDQYFDIVTPEMANATTVALDLGCGTGRWSKYLSRRVKFIEAVDPGEAVLAAVRHTASCPNIRVTKAGYGSLPFARESFDFVFSLGVVHHLPDTAAAVARGSLHVEGPGWLLLYIYYNLDNRGALHRLLFGVADRCRRPISRLPRRLKFLVCEAIASAATHRSWLFARFADLPAGRPEQGASAYCVDKPWKVIRNDSLDRFGTPLEQRFSRRRDRADAGRRRTG